MKPPTDRICLVIPYYEAGEDLVESLESVRLGRADLIVVVDDGSRRRPARDLVPPTVGDTPVRLVEMARNGGITAALRAGIAAVPADFALIARLDCGDTCRPTRFTAQRELLAAHPGVVLVGSWVDFVSPDGAFLYRLEQPVDPAAVRRRMRVNCAITHPAAMFRRDAYDRVGGYPTRFPAAEDFALFSLMLQHGEAANIPQALVRCRTGDGGISDRRRRTQLASRCRILLERFDWHPLAVYGLLRAVGQMATPRSWSTRAHRIRVRLTGGRPQAGPAGPPLRRNPPG